MADLADIFIALPGGPGTLEEITEVVSWAVLALHPCPCIFLILIITIITLEIFMI